MEKKFVKVPFDVEMAKRISKGEVEGTIITNDGCKVKIVCWDSNYEFNYPIVALIQDGEKEYYNTYRIDGNYNNAPSNELAKLILEVPEYMTFKDGDIIYCEFAKSNGDYCKWVSIIKGKVEGSGGILCYNGYVGYVLDTNMEIERLMYDFPVNCIDLIRKATQSEIAMLIEALEKFISEHSNVEENGKEFKLKPFDRVLCRDSETEKWCADFFSHSTEYEDYQCVGMTWKHCIPYNDRTAHLVGTTDNYNEDEKAME